MTPRVSLVREDRIDVPRGAGTMAASLSARARRVESSISRPWTTPAGSDSAKDELLRIAEEALELRRLL
jgi:hypothetical protein